MVKTALLINVLIFTTLKCFVSSLVTPGTDDSTHISLLNESELSFNTTKNVKGSLRYGFQNTQDCQIFEKAFLCIRTCLDKGFDIARADKNCLCTCKKNGDLAKHKVAYVGVTKWKLTAPTTSVPPWAQKYTTKLFAVIPNDYEINGDEPATQNVLSAKNTTPELQNKTEYTTKGKGGSKTTNNSSDDSTDLLNVTSTDTIHTFNQTQGDGEESNNTTINQANGTTLAGDNDNTTDINSTPAE